MKRLQNNKLWLKNASIFSHNQINNYRYDNNQLDYPEDLLPFSDSNFWKSLSNGDKKKIKSMAFIIYQYKTIIIETKFITTICNILLSNNSLFNDKNLEIEKMLQNTLIDEAYHTSLAYDSIHMIVENTGLNVNLESELALDILDKCNNKKTFKEKEEALFIHAVYLETIISDYLKIQVKMNPQDILRKLVEIHYDDEKSHHSLFKKLYKDFLNLGTHDSSFIKNEINNISKALYDQDIKIWKELMLDNNIIEYKELLNVSKDHKHICKHANKMKLNLTKDQELINEY